MRPVLAAALIIFAGIACKDSSSNKPNAAPANAIALKIAYGSEKKTWLEEAARSFSAANIKTKSGRPVAVELMPMGSGEAMQGILDGSMKAHVFSPASSAYVVLLNHKWLSSAGHTKAISPAGEPVVLSPIVIAMWKPAAEQLGWPQKILSWKDLLSMGAELKLGHTHPGYSTSGLLAVLAEAYAGAKKTRGLSAADLDSKEVQEFVNTIEKTIVHYGKSTGFFADKMQQRGPGYMSAAVLYENLVIESYAKAAPGSTPLVAVYPVEGTFWADHPYAVLDAPWVGDAEREAAETFLAHLKSRPVQENALALGFRPADPALAIGAPIDAAHGVDPKQPQTLLEIPEAPVLEKLIDLWQQKKKPTDVMVVFDKSGSMAGKPLAEAKVGAQAFLKMLQDQDRVSLLTFDSAVGRPTPLVELATGRASLLSQIEKIQAGGGTALYDATFAAHLSMNEQTKQQQDRIRAVVIMTDGKDAGSRLDLDRLGEKLRSGGQEVKLFTISYGDADPAVLEQIAEAARGATAKGTTETIVQVYRDMASFF